MFDSVPKTELAIENHLKNNSIFLENKCWEIRNSPLGDRGIFAKRDIEPGQVVFMDYPIIIGPRIKTEIQPVCVNCYNLDDLKTCENKCGLPVCSIQCQNSKLHKKECQLINSWKNGLDLQDYKIMLACLTPLRSVFLNEDGRHLVNLLKAHHHPKHEVIVDTLKKYLNFTIPAEDEQFMRLVCSVLDANAFEVLVGSSSKQSTLRGLYPLGSLLNHGCSPNTTRVFDAEQRMIVRATIFISRNTEICNSYSRLIWGTPTRRFHLLSTKHFECRCERCCDPSEYGTNLNGLKCLKCKNVVLPEDALKMDTVWRCTECTTIMTNDKVGLVNSILGSQVKMIENSQDVSFLLILLDQLSKIVPPSNQIVVELKYKLMWILGYNEGYIWKDLSIELINKKEEICRDILDVLWRLRTGLCKMRGLLLYELYHCLEQKERRSGMQNSDIERKNLLDEATNILMYDIAAPEELKHRWEKKSIIDKQC